MAVCRGSAVKIPACLETLISIITEFRILAFLMATSVAAPMKDPSEPQFCYKYNKVTCLLFPLALQKLNK